MHCCGHCPAVDACCVASIGDARLPEGSVGFAVQAIAMAALVLSAAPPCRASGPLSSTDRRTKAAAAPPRAARRRLEVTACARCLAAGAARPLVPALQQLGCRGPASVAAVKEGAETASPQRQQQQAADSSAHDQPQQGAAPPAPAGEEQQDGVGVKAALAALRFYKGVISPLLPPACRFLPTCSGKRSVWVLSWACRCSFSMGGQPTRRAAVPDA